MPFIDKVIHNLDPYVNTEYFEDEIHSIKEHIKVLINSKDKNTDLLTLGDLDINAKHLAIVISEKVYHIISTCECRVKVLNIEYNETLAPWQLIFFIHLCFSNNHFKEFNIQITFKNNRYCEVI